MSRHVTDFIAKADDYKGHSMALRDYATYDDQAAGWPRSRNQPVGAAVLALLGTRAVYPRSSAVGSG